MINFKDTHHGVARQSLQDCALRERQGRGSSAVWPSAPTAWFVNDGKECSDATEELFTIKGSSTSAE
jgi:hypothetical protein